jgi:hypothetical protein
MELEAFPVPTRNILANLFKSKTFSELSPILIHKEFLSIRILSFRILVGSTAERASKKMVLAILFISYKEKDSKIESSSITM